MRLKNVRRAWFRSDGWQVIITKNLEGGKNCECYVSKKIQETNIGFSYINKIITMSL